jgi:hypothetical protein
MFPRLLRRWGVLALAVAAAACSDDAVIDGGNEPEPEPLEEPEPEPMSEPEPEPALEAGAPSPECEVREFEDDSANVPFERLEARVVDTDGEPLVGVKAQACGINLCLFGDTDELGRIVHQDDQEFQRLAFKYGDGIHQAQLAFVLDEQPEHLLGDQVTLVFPPLETGDRFEPGATLSSEGISLELAAEVDVTFDVFSYDEDEYRFVAREFPAGAFPEAAASERFVVMAALGPAHTKLCPPAKLVLPNSAALEPGRELSVFVHNSNNLFPFAPYGGWVEMATAKVSDDGERIETDDEQGLTYLGVIGLR